MQAVCTNDLTDGAADIGEGKTNGRPMADNKQITSGVLAVIADRACSTSGMRTATRTTCSTTRFMMQTLLPVDIHRQVGIEGPGLLLATRHDDWRRPD
ncbi:MAG: hypothetical protein LIV22_05090 [Olegusella sp.]|nr:hypothetical protein [Olegusella sp.]